jgi:hypothetical protein
MGKLKGTNILSNFVIRNSHIQIVIRETKLNMIDTLHKDKENDIKKKTYSWVLEMLSSRFPREQAPQACNVV